MSPKALLRHKLSVSALAEIEHGTFQAVIDEIDSIDRTHVERLLFCSGKVYYDLMAKEPGSHVAVVRVEALYPWPLDEVSRLVDRYPNIDEVAWVQEEPKNMGAWSYVAPRLRVAAGNALVIRYIGRPERASPAVEEHQVDPLEEQTQAWLFAIAGGIQENVHPLQLIDDLRHALGHAPDAPEPIDAILADIDRLVFPNATHWQHPGFFAYFATVRADVNQVDGKNVLVYTFTEEQTIRDIRIAGKEIERRSGRSHSHVRVA